MDTTPFKQRKKAAHEEHDKRVLHSQRILDAQLAEIARDMLAALDDDAAEAQAPAVTTAEPVADDRPAFAPGLAPDSPPTGGTQDALSPGAATATDIAPPLGDTAAAAPTSTPAAEASAAADEDPFAAPRPAPAKAVNRAPAKAAPKPASPPSNGAQRAPALVDGGLF